MAGSPLNAGRRISIPYLGATASNFSISSFVGGRAVVAPSGSGTPTSKNIFSRPAGATEISILAGRLALVLEGVRRADRHVGEHPRRRHDPLAVDRERDLAFEDVEALFLPAVDVRGRSAARRHEASHKAYLPFVSSPVARKRYTSPTTAMVRPWGGVLMVGWCGAAIVPSLSRCMATGRRLSGVTHLPQMPGDGPSQEQRNQPEGWPGEGGLRVQLKGAGDSGSGPRSARTPRTPRTRSPAGTAGPRTRSYEAAATFQAATPRSPRRASTRPCS